MEEDTIEIKRSKRIREERKQVQVSIESNSSKNVIKLHELENDKISRIFAELESGRIIVVPIGFPQAGKSLFLSSLLYYAKKGRDTAFTCILKEKFPFDSGRKIADEMIGAFDRRDMYKVSTAGTLDLIGVDIEPTRNELPTLKLAFLDLSGEDLKGIKQSENAAFTTKIDAVFQGMKANKSKVIFVLTTPYEPAIEDNETLDDAHTREDNLHSDFINYLRERQKGLSKNAHIFIIVTQWDKNEEENENELPEEREKSVKEFISAKRESILGWVQKKPSVAWGTYSIGDLYEEEDMERKIKIQKINRISVIYPKRFWHALYEICTGKKLEKKVWWQKLFGCN